MPWLLHSQITWKLGLTVLFDLFKKHLWGKNTTAYISWVINYTYKTLQITTKGVVFTDKITIWQKLEWFSSGYCETFTRQSFLTPLKTVGEPVLLARTSAERWSEFQHLISQHIGIRGAFVGQSTQQMFTQSMQEADEVTMRVQNHCGAGLCFM